MKFAHSSISADKSGWNIQSFQNLNVFKVVLRRNRLGRNLIGKARLQGANNLGSASCGLSAGAKLLDKKKLQLHRSCTLHKTHHEAERLAHVTIERILN
jgi:hypothetical protein